MKVTFDYLDEFARGAKALRKKYPSSVRFVNNFRFRYRYRYR